MKKGLLIILFLYVGNTLLSQEFIRYEIPIYYTHNNPIYYTEDDWNVIKLQESAKLYMDADGGSNIDFGIGLKLNIYKSFKFKFGYHNWAKVFCPRYEGIYSGKQFAPEFVYPYGDNIGSMDENSFIIQEYGSIRYNALYFNLIWDFRYIYFGAGVDFSINDYYRGTFEVYDQEGNLVATMKDQKQSALAQNFSSQADVLLLIGANIRSFKRITLKPTFELAMPFSPFYSAQVYTYNSGYGSYNYSMDQTGVDLNTLVLKFGVVAELNLTK